MLDNIKSSIILKKIFGNIVYRIQLNIIKLNKRIKKRLKITKESASHMINKLVRLGYLQSTINFKPNTKRVESRILRVNKDLTINTNEDTPLTYVQITSL